MTEPVVEKPEIPAEYGNPTQRLEWSDVARRLVGASVYWIASTRPDGRPHVIPRDGMWLEGRSLLRGQCDDRALSQHHSHPYVAVHIGDGQEAIIVEGAVETGKPTEELPRASLNESFSKYPQYGRIDPSRYMGGVSVLRPRRVLTWTSLAENATRFRFD